MSCVIPRSQKQCQTGPVRISEDFHEDKKAFEELYRLYMENSGRKSMRRPFNPGNDLKTILPAKTCFRAKLLGLHFNGRFIIQIDDDELAELRRSLSRFYAEDLTRKQYRISRSELREEIRVCYMSTSGEFSRGRIVYIDRTLLFCTVEDIDTAEYHSVHLDSLFWLDELCQHIPRKAIECELDGLELMDKGEMVDAFTIIRLNDPRICVTVHQTKGRNGVPVVSIVTRADDKLNLLDLMKVSKVSEVDQSQSANSTATAATYRKVKKWFVPANAEIAEAYEIAVQDVKSFFENWNHTEGILLKKLYGKITTASGRPISWEMMGFGHWYIFLFHCDQFFYLKASVPDKNGTFLAYPSQFPDIPTDTVGYTRVQSELLLLLLPQNLFHDIVEKYSIAKGVENENFYGQSRSNIECTTEFRSTSISSVATGQEYENGTKLSESGNPPQPTPTSHNKTPDKSENGAKFSEGGDLTQSTSHTKTPYKLQDGAKVSDSGCVKYTRSHTKTFEKLENGMKLSQSDYSAHSASHAKTQEKSENEGKSSYTLHSTSHAKAPKVIMKFTNPLYRSNLKQLNETKNYYGIRNSLTEEETPNFFLPGFIEPPEIPPPQDWNDESWKFMTVRPVRAKPLPNRRMHSGMPPVEKFQWPSSPTFNAAILGADSYGFMYIELCDHGLKEHYKQLETSLHEFYSVEKTRVALMLSPAEIKRMNCAQLVAVQRNSRYWRARIFHVDVEEAVCFLIGADDPEFFFATFSGLYQLDLQFQYLPPKAKMCILDGLEEHLLTDRIAEAIAMTPLYSSEVVVTVSNQKDNKFGLPHVSMTIDGQDFSRLLKKEAGALLRKTELQELQACRHEQDQVLQYLKTVKYLPP